MLPDFNYVSFTLIHHTGNWAVKVYEQDMVYFPVF